MVSGDHMANPNVQPSAFPSKMPSKTTDDVLNGLHQVVQQRAVQSAQSVFASIESAATSASEMHCSEGMCQLSWKPPSNTTKSL